MGVSEEFKVHRSLDVLGHIHEGGAWGGVWGHLGRLYLQALLKSSVASEVLEADYFTLARRALIRSKRFIIASDILAICITTRA